MKLLLPLLCFTVTMVKANPQALDHQLLSAMLTFGGSENALHLQQLPQPLKTLRLPAKWEVVGHIKDATNNSSFLLSQHSLADTHQQSHQLLLAANFNPLEPFDIGSPRGGFVPHGSGIKQPQPSGYCHHRWGTIYPTISEFSFGTLVLYNLQRLGDHTQGCEQHQPLFHSNMSGAFTTMTSTMLDLPRLALPATVGLSLNIHSGHFGELQGMGDKTFHTIAVDISGFDGNLVEHFSRQLSSQGWQLDPKKTAASTAGLLFIDQSKQQLLQLQIIQLQPDTMELTLTLRRLAF